VLVPVMGKSLNVPGASGFGEWANRPILLYSRAVVARDLDRAAFQIGSLFALVPTLPTRSRILGHDERTRGPFYAML
jgi:hypothetical protein